MDYLGWLVARPPLSNLTRFMDFLLETNLPEPTKLCAGSYSVPRTPNKSRRVNGLARWPLYIHTFNGLSCSLDSPFERMGLSHSYSRQAVEVNGLRLANWLIHTYISQVLFDRLGKSYLLFHLHAALVQFI